MSFKVGDWVMITNPDDASIDTYPPHHIFKIHSVESNSLNFPFGASIGVYDEELTKLNDGKLTKLEKLIYGVSD